MIEYQPGDIFCTRGTGILSWLIRFFSRGWGESRTQVNHSGIVVTGGKAIDSAQGATVVEAMRKVVWRPLASHRSPIIVFRPKVPPAGELAAGIHVKRAFRYENRTYGYGKIILHALDWFLGGAYVFRRLGRMYKYPICSWIVASAFAGTGEDFGVPVGQAQPDDIYDWCMEHHELYDIIHDLAPLSAQK